MEWELLRKENGQCVMFSIALGVIIPTFCCIAKIIETRSVDSHRSSSTIGTLNVTDRGLRQGEVWGVSPDISDPGGGLEHMNCSKFEETNVVRLPYFELPHESCPSDLLAVGGGGENSCSSWCSSAPTESPVGRRPCSDTATETETPSRVNLVVKSVECLGRTQKEAVI